MATLHESPVTAEIPADWLAEFEAAARRPLATRRRDAGEPSQRLVTARSCETSAPTVGKRSADYGEKDSTGRMTTASEVHLRQGHTMGRRTAPSEATSMSARARAKASRCSRTKTSGV